MSDFWIWVGLIVGAWIAFQLGAMPLTERRLIRRRASNPRFVTHIENTITISTDR